MITPAHRSLRMPRLAVAAVGLGAATGLALVPGTAFAASHGGGAAQAHGQHGSTHSHAAVQLKDKGWQAQSDPDGDTNGGVDQPGGQGGTIGAQDGNNGSGNDADCEDDNRGRGIPGHCKTKPSHGKAHEHVPGSKGSTPSTPSQPTQPGKPSTPGSTPTTPDEGTGAPTSSEVLAPELTASSSVLAPAAQGAAAASGPATAATATPTAATLPNTGADAELLWLLVGGAVALGAGARTVAKARQSA